MDELKFSASAFIAWLIHRLLKKAQTCLNRKANKKNLLKLCLKSQKPDKNLLLTKKLTEMEIFISNFLFLVFRATSNLKLVYIV